MCADAIGNRRLRVIIGTFLEQYSKALSRIEKSTIVSTIVDIVQDACPVGAFVKFEDGQWWEVGDFAARERVGSMLRDSLHDQYKSSSKAKLARRRAKQEGSDKDNSPVKKKCNEDEDEETEAKCESKDGSESESDALSAKNKPDSSTLHLNQNCLLTAMNDCETAERITTSDVLKRERVQNQRIIVQNNPLFPKKSRPVKPSSWFGTPSNYSSMKVQRACSEPSVSLSPIPSFDGMKIPRFQSYDSIHQFSEPVMKRARFNETFARFPQQVSNNYDSVFERGFHDVDSPSFVQRPLPLPVEVCMSFSSSPGEDPPHPDRINTWSP
jgi:hypothetical protein